MAEVESKLEPKSEEIETKPEINVTKEESKSEDAKDDSFSEAKDKVIFLTEDEASVPSKVTLDENINDDAPPGLILSNGDINWNCPCLGGMAVGPCGVEFRAAFSCFHYSTEEPKGSECIEKFAEMQSCMQQHPELYSKEEEASQAEEPKAENVPAKTDTPEQELAAETAPSTSDVPSESAESASDAPSASPESAPTSIESSEQVESEKAADLPPSSPPSPTPSL